MAVLMTTAQAAVYLEVETSTVRHLIRDGHLTATKHGRDWLIRLEDLEAYDRRRRKRKKKDRGDLD